jgi:iron complex transport system substrate-binding protein
VPGRMKRIAGFVAALAMLAASTPTRAEQVTLTDIKGRSVSLALPLQRVLLAEGRQIHTVAALDREAPFARVVGWGADLEKADPESYAAYVALYPQAAALPKFGSVTGGGFDVEAAIALKPDVVLLNYEAQRASDETRLIEKLGSVGIAVLYIDFRHAPFENTEPSLRLLGKLFGREEVAERLIAFRAAQMVRVTERLAQYPMLKRPLVMVDRIPGYSEDCCLTFGPENFGRMVEVAGGRNLGSELLSGTFGTLNPEVIVARDPEVLIVTGGSFGALAPGGGWVGLGPGADMALARSKLATLARRPAFLHSSAVANHRVHAIWHQFYNNPYQFVAIQRIATWLHPDLFTDIDPDATLRELHERFLPIPYRPGYWVDLSPARGETLRLP